MINPTTLYPSTNQLSDDDKKLLINNPRVRREVASKSLTHFISYYLPHYIQYQMAPFHHEILRLLQDHINKLLVIVAFRSSGKSTLVSLAYILWSIMGVHEKKHVVLVSQTQRQAKQLLQHIRDELESNRILRQDFGPFQEESAEWGSYSLVSPKYGARITALSIEQSIRGIRHGPHRPDLIICDDVEDLQWVKMFENREKTSQLFFSEINSVGDLNTRIIVLGNKLHEDSLTMRLKKRIVEKTIEGVYREYPLMDQSNAVLWPAKFPNEASIERLKKRVGDLRTFQREYLCQIIPMDDQIILPEWIRCYDQMPEKIKKHDFRFSLLSVDPAASLKETADNTAILSASIFGEKNQMRIYIHPYPINQKINPADIEDVVKRESKSLGNGSPVKILFESNGFQRMIAERLERDHFPVKQVQNVTIDKRERLSLVAPYVKNGVVLFPKQGVDTLMSQLLGFGTEVHDDLVDAFTILISYVINMKYHRKCIGIGTLDWNTGDLDMNFIEYD